METFKNCPGHKFEKVTYRHCQDCDADARDARFKCKYCKGKVIKETYWYCPKCGIVR